MKINRLMLVLLLAAIAGCSDGDQLHGLVGESDAMYFQQAERRPNDLLAYEHSIVVDIGKDELSASFQSLTEACAGDRKNQCTLLNSEIRHGEHTAAHIRMRIEPDGVEALVTLATESGDIIRYSTHVEDLAKTITDIDKRLAILTTTRDKLLELEERGAANVDSLIKIVSELTVVQAELEQLTGRSAFQRQRVDMDILNIQFVVEGKRSSWQPILDSLSAFGRNLSDGLADTIHALAYLLPWSVLIFFTVYLLLRLWRRSRAK